MNKPMTLIHKKSFQGSFRLQLTEDHGKPDLKYPCVVLSNLTVTIYKFHIYQAASAIFFSNKQSITMDYIKNHFFSDKFYT